MTRNASDMNVAGVFRTVDKEATSQLPYLSNPALGSESKQRGGVSTQADTSLNVDKSLSIEYKMPRSALPKNILNTYLQESREELASISSVHLGTETPSGMPILQTLDQTMDRPVYSSSKNIPRKANKSEVP